MSTTVQCVSPCGGCSSALLSRWPLPSWPSRPLPQLSTSPCSVHVFKCVVRDVVREIVLRHCCCAEKF
eukprot:2436-Heterococcus_DN1.PRE.1